MSRFCCNKIKMQIGKEDVAGDIGASSSEAGETGLLLESSERQQLNGPQSELSISQERYFNNILNKHISRLSIAKSALMQKEGTLTNQILEGRYDIHKKQWSSHQERNGSLQKNTNSTSRIISKRQLQEQLHNIQSRLRQETVPKQSRVLSEEERLQFIKKIQQQRKVLIQKRREATKLEQERRLQEELKAKEETDRINQQKKEKRKQQLLQKMKALEEQRKARAQMQANQQSSLRQKLAQKTMAEKMENQYLRMQNDQLQEKKKRLAEIRSLHKPIDKHELDAHANRYELIQKERLEAYKNKKKNSNPDSAAVFYKSAFYKKIQKEEKVYLETQHQEEVQRLKEIKDKLKRFSEHVKNDFKPSIDQKKAEQLRFRSENFKRRSMSVSNAETPRKIGLRYLQFSKIKVEHQKLLGEEQQQSEEEEKKHIDYLAQLRQKNKGARQNAKSLLDALERKGLSKEQKAKKIIEFASRLELKARRKEEISKMEGSMSEELDSLYLQAIQAKLSLLDDS